MATETTAHTLELPDDPEQQNEVFLEAFNSGEGAVFDSLYRADAISNLSGRPLTGTERTRVITEMLAQKPLLDAEFREAHVAGDVMLIVVDYDLDLPEPDGARVRMRGTCTDVLRRGADGRWLMVIDRPVPTEAVA